MISSWPDETDRFRRTARLLWVAIAAVASVTAAALAFSGLHLDLASNPFLIAAGIGYWAIAWVYRSLRADEQIAIAIETTGQLLLIVLLGIVLSYPAATAALPYRDAELYAIDQWLGFDRHAYVDFVSNRDWLVTTVNIIYLTMQPQLGLVPLVLILARRLDRLQQFVMAFTIAVMLTVAIFVFVPAVGAFVHVDLTPEEYARLPAAIYTPARSLDALRSGALAFVPLNDLEGLVAFPSFHTAAGLLYAWALWPLRRLRWPAIILNCAMIATTPLGGAHYMTDLLGGAIISVAAVLVARRVCAGRPHARSIHHGSESGRINWSHFITASRLRFNYSTAPAPLWRHTEAPDSCATVPRRITGVNTE
jgi:membrane-associated phospholipid phosphatase